MSVDPEKIRDMFAKVANQYDSANSVLSLGIHHLWRAKLVRMSGAKPQQKVLDCATGTGDLAIAFKKAVGRDGHVVGTDFCQEMLERAPQKSAEMGLDIDWKIADVTNLQFHDNDFDITSIAFGIRNVADPLLALREMARVTKPGGKVMVLEFGQVAIPGLSQAYEMYSKKVLPRIGGWLTGQPQAYSYLQSSSAVFPCREEFLQLMRESNCYSELHYSTLSAGIAYIYSAVVK